MVRRIFVDAGIALFACLVACGGSSSSGGSNGAGGADHCGSVPACGGSNVVGTWKIVDACESASPGTASASCPGETVQVSSVSAAGTITLNADMTYSSSVSTSATVVLSIPMSCISSGGVTITCDQLGMAASALDGGDITSCTTSGSNCNCSASASSPTTSDSGTYSISGTTVTITSANGGTASMEGYCVQGNTLHILSLSSTMSAGAMGMATITSDIVAQRQ
ncbi:MAG: hypothetical protein WBY94_30455 [Polyangiaceae bacterium]